MANRIRPYSVTVYRFSLGECSNNGVTARYNSLPLFAEGVSKEDILAWCKERVARLKEQDPTLHEDIALKKVKEQCLQAETLWRGTKHEHVRANVVFPIPGYLYVAGGNQVEGDSSYHEDICPYAIHVIDRKETQEEYDFLSR